RSEVEKQQTIEPDELRALIQFLKSHHRTTFKKLRKGLIYAGSDEQDVQALLGVVTEKKHGLYCFLTVLASLDLKNTR
ncbi:MAG: hypothetical protein CMK92_06875, partial [Pseudomonas sp.]|nr:hypothetical protein [Pseudomonas sp.]